MTGGVGGSREAPSYAHLVNAIARRMTDLAGEGEEADLGHGIAAVRDEIATALDHAESIAAVIDSARDQGAASLS